MHRLIKKHGIEPREYRPRGGRGLVARSALMQLKSERRAITRAAVQFHIVD
ncbi:MAG TPA: hypothetical protein VIV11_11880 [Kofleriaceae bacterium]